MNTINEITYQEIQQLQAQPFVELLSRLLHLEAMSHNLPLRGVSVPLKITVPDGGEDGSVKWSDGVDHTDYLPSRNICIQAKATTMSAKDCKEEILSVIGTGKKKVISLKRQVKKCFDEDGTYILFVREHIVEQNIDDRILKIREGITEAGESYADTVKIEIYDSNKIASWVNQHPSAFAFVCERIGRPQTLPLKTLDKWRTKEGGEFSIPYQLTAQLETLCQQIGEQATEGGRIIRVTGLSGLGKSRLVFQAFNMMDEQSIIGKMSRSSVLYYDASMATGSFIDLVANLCRTNAKCNLIVDNCSLEIHNRLKQEIRETKFNLITTHTDPNESMSSDEGSVQIQLASEDFIPIVPLILKERFNGISEVDLRRIEEFAQGFPLIAVLLAKQVQSGSRNIGQLTEESILSKLLGIEDSDTKTRKILTSIALFDYVGYSRELVAQRNSLAKDRLILRMVDDDTVMEGDFYETCQKYIKRGIIEKNGRMINLKPKPLALRLARDWWDSFPEDKIEELLLSVTNMGLATQLCDQIARLDFVPKAKELTEKLCGQSGLFGKAEVLNSEQGSRLFRSLVEVNPEACVKCLDRVLGKMSLEELKAIDKGRRNLVWALEKLAFRTETFSKASNILLLLAVSENETWSNNATGQFLHLFQTMLAGTEADLGARLQVLQTIMASQDSEKKRLGLKAIERGLKTHSFSRTVGAERQGSSAELQDFRPNSGDIIGYWEQLLDLVYHEVSERTEFHDKAKQILAESIFQLSIPKSFKTILPVIQKTIEKEGTDWPEALKACKRCLRNANVSLSDAERSTLKELIDSLEPTDLKSRYRGIISNPSWDDFERDGNGVWDKMKTRSQEFARQFYKEVPSMEEYFDLFYHGDQHQGIVFGETLSLCMTGDKRLNFLKSSINYFKNAGQEALNPIVMVGFLNNTDEKILNIALDLMSETPSLDHTSFSIARNVRVSSERIGKLFDLIDRNPDLTVGEFVGFRYGRALDELKVEEVAAFCDRLADSGIEGIWTSLILIESYCYNETSKWEGLKETTRKILLNKAILKPDGLKISIDGYGWEDLVRRIVSNPIESNFAIHIAEEIVDFCNTTNFNYGLDVPVKNVLIILLEKHFSAVWPTIGKAILAKDDDYIIFFHFQHLVGSSFSSDEGLIFKYGDEDIIFNWVEENGLFAAQRIAAIMPTVLSQEASGWHPFAVRVINKFGSDVDVLSQLTSNIGSFSWSGSLVPMYEQHKAAFVFFLNHEFESVREWAESQIEYAIKRIEQEQISDDERFL